MLPPGLVRAKVQQRQLLPSFIDPDRPGIRAVAESLFELYTRSADASARLGAVQEEVDALCEDRRDHRMVRGLAHLAHGKCTLTEPESTLPDPPSLRARLFALAVERGPLEVDPRRAAITGRPTAEHLLAEVADDLSVAPRAIADGMYADLPSEQRLVQFDVHASDWLIHRYNVALVQGLLARATEVEIHLDAPSTPRLKQLFRWVKFHQLLHRVNIEADRVRVLLDGPMSLFQGSTRYGRNLARFFPALCLQDGPWELRATVLWTRARHQKELRVDHRMGLVSHYEDTGAYASKPVQYLAEHFANANTVWELEDGRAPLVLGPDDVVMPDFHARCGDRVAHLEVIGTWRLEKLQARLDRLDAATDMPLVLAVSRRLAGKKGANVPDHPRVVAFAEAPSPRKIAEAFERIAIRGAPAG